MQALESQLQRLQEWQAAGVQLLDELGESTAALRARVGAAEREAAGLVSEVAAHQPTVRLTPGRGSGSGGGQQAAGQQWRAPKRARRPSNAAPEEDEGEEGVSALAPPGPDAAAAAAMFGATDSGVSSLREAMGALQAPVHEALHSGALRREVNTCLVPMHHTTACQHRPSPLDPPAALVGRLHPLPLAPRCVPLRAARREVRVQVSWGGGLWAVGDGRVRACRW
jgi:hypothetical protein